MLQKYRGEINELKTKLTQLSDKEAETTQLAAEKMRLEEELHQQQLVRTALKERIDHLTKLILTSSSFNSQAIISSWGSPTEESSRSGLRKGGGRSREDASEYNVHNNALSLDINFDVMIYRQLQSIARWMKTPITIETKLRS